MCKYPFGSGGKRVIVAIVVLIGMKIVLEKHFNFLYFLNLSVNL